MKYAWEIVGSNYVALSHFHYCEATVPQASTQRRITAHSHPPPGMQNLHHI